MMTWDHMIITLHWPCPLPTHMQVCSFGTRSTGLGSIVFNRRQDSLRSRLAHLAGRTNDYTVTTLHRYLVIVYYSLHVVMVFRTWYGACSVVMYNKYIDIISHVPALPPPPLSPPPSFFPPSSPSSSLLSLYPSLSPPPSLFILQVIKAGVLTNMTLKGNLCILH